MARKAPEVNQVRVLVSRLGDALRAASSPCLAAAKGQDAFSASMVLRRIHNQFFGQAMGAHCRYAIYKSEEALKVINSTSETLIHCEHTIPVGVAVRNLWRFMDKTKSGDEELLDWVLNYTIVTACTQKERHSKIGLAMPRIYTENERLRAWSRHHPDMLADGEWELTARPFLRYHGTSVRVKRGYETIDLPNFTLRDHQYWIAKFPQYHAVTYFR